MQLSDFIALLPNAKPAGGGWQARCPAHDDRVASLSVTERDGKILCRCHAGCTFADIIGALGVSARDMHTTEQDTRSRPDLVHTYDYVDPDGGLLYQVCRFQPKSFRQRRPDPDKPGAWLWNLDGVQRVLYRLPAIIAAIEAGKTIFLVEGEKDADNLAALDLRATTNAGGASKWLPSFSDTLRRAKSVVIIPDADEPGRKHAALVHSQLPNSVIIELPGLKLKQDVSDWLANGGTRAALTDLARAAILNPPAEPEPEPDVPQPSRPDDPQQCRLEGAAQIPDIAARTEATLNSRPSRALKQAMSDEICDFARRYYFLSCAVDDDAPLWIRATGDVFAIEDNQNMQDQISDFRVNASETFFKWLLSALRTSARKPDVMRIELRRYTYRDVKSGEVYVSCGPRRIITSTGRVLTNGDRNIYFAADSVLPEWQPVPGAPDVDALFADPLDPQLTSPPEAHEYTPEYQRLLLRAWLACAIGGVRPLPILVPVGQSSSGKTTLARAIMKLIRGDRGDVVSLPEKQRDAETLLSNSPAIAIDNADNVQPAPWLADLLCMTSTGGRVETRTLYSDSGITSRTLTAALIITSRTPAWATGRADVQERCLPLFLRERKDDSRGDDARLVESVLQRRDAMLAWGSRASCTSIASGLPGRFQAFASVVCQLDAERGPAALQAMGRANRVGLADLHPLVEAILVYGKPLKGTPKEILSILRGAGHDLPYLGGGKSAANLLREHRTLIGNVLEAREGNNTVFYVTPQNTTGEPGETGVPVTVHVVGKIYDGCDNSGFSGFSGFEPDEDEKTF